MANSRLPCLTWEITCKTTYSNQWRTGTKGADCIRKGLLREALGLRGGDDGIRTHDPHVANVMLSQLSYIPTRSALSRKH